MSQPRVLISDKLSPRAKEIFEERGVAVDVKTGMTPDALKACIGDYHGLAIRSATKATADVLAAATNMKVIGRAGIGVDNVDIPEASKRGVVVMNTPFGNSITTAEHAIAMMFATARQIPEADASTRAGKWEKSKFMGVELYSKTLGLIGAGNIGAIVASRAVGLQMKVVAYDPFLSEERALELGVEKVDLDTLLARADFITLHVPKTDQTKHMIDAAAIAKMKPGVRIINCARGGLVVEADLKAALDSGQVAGAAFDVFAEEPAKANPLFDAPNMICTPHLGASTEEAQENVALQVAEQMSDYLMTGAVVNALNMPSISAEDAPRLKPYVRLAELLGGFAGQLTTGEVDEARIEYAGAAAALNTRPMTAAALTGLLRPQLESVNMVSAPLMAKERDIDVVEAKRERCDDYPSLITVTVSSEGRTRSISGAVFGSGQPRIVNIKGIPIEAEPTPHMLYITNEDKPGMIGRMGATLGDCGVNIATFALGRSEPGGDAISLIAVDAPPSTEALGKLNALAGVVSAKELRF